MNSDLHPADISPLKVDLSCVGDQNEVEQLEPFKRVLGLIPGSVLIDVENPT